MRARNILLALLIIVAGLTITASRRGVFGGWSRSARGLVETVESLAAGLEDGDWREVERFSRELDITGASSLAIENPNGEVAVTAQEQGLARVAVVRYGRGDNAEQAAADARCARLDISRLGDVVTVRVSGPRHFAARARLDLDVVAPAQLAVNIKTASGPVEVRSMTKAVSVTAASGDVGVTGAGRVWLLTASGDAELRDIGGDVECRVVSGDLSLENIAGGVQVSGVSGDIEAHDLRGPVSVSTVSGSLTLDGYAGPDATLGSTSGDVQVSLSSPLTGNLAARTVSGDISVTLPSGSDSAVDLGSTSGDINPDLPLREASRRRGHVTGLLGAGRGRLELRSVSGSLTVRLAPGRREET